MRKQPNPEPDPQIALAAQRMLAQPVYQLNPGQAPATTSPARQPLRVGGRLIAELPRSHRRAGK